MTKPPDVDRLADLDADIAAGIPAETPTDPASRTVLDALAATRAELASLPPVPLPPELTARWVVALAAAPTDEVPSPVSATTTDGPARPRKGRARKRVLRHPFSRTGGAAPPRTDGRSHEDHQLGARAATYGRERTEPTITPPSGPVRRPRPAIAVGLALVAVLVVAGVVQGTAPHDVTSAELGGVARASVGSLDAGELGDPVRRAGCLRSVAPPGLTPDAALVGGRGVRFEGRPAILLVLASGRLGRFRIVVVDPACGPVGGTLLADTVIGG